MEIFGNDIEIQQGENFNMDVLLSASNLEYIPYIISSERKNPFFVITVASTKYEKNMRYVHSWWNDVINGLHPIQTFYQTTPVNLGELTEAPVVADFEGNIDDWEQRRIRYLYQYTLETEDIDEKLGHKPYHYVYVDYSSGSSIVRNDDYECKIIQNFSSDITRLWGAQNYMYQITLLDGKTNKEVILATYEKYGSSHPDFPIPRKPDGELYSADEQWGDSEQEYIKSAYSYIKRQWPNLLQPDIDADSPLYYIDNPETIVSPSKLTVNNNLRQMI